MAHGWQILKLGVVLCSNIRYKHSRYVFTHYSIYLYHQTFFCLHFVFCNVATYHIWMWKEIIHINITCFFVKYSCTLLTIPLNISQKFQQMDVNTRLNTPQRLWLYIYFLHFTESWFEYSISNIFCIFLLAVFFTWHTSKRECILIDPLLLL